MIIPKEAENIIRLLRDNTHDAYIVGGCVRDALLGRTPNDWDITTDARPEEIKRIFRRTVDTGIQHGTVTVIVNGKGYEVTTYRVDGDYSDHRRPDTVEFTDSLFEDLKRRDFTINAMAYNHDRGLVDEFGGQEDLAKGLVRCVGEPDERFNEDALRILRAIRFSAGLGFEIEEKTLGAIGGHIKDLTAVSPERIMTELNKIIRSDHPEKMSLLWETGMAPYISGHFCLIRDAGGLLPGYKGSWAALMRDNTPEEAAVILKELKTDNDTLNRTMALIDEYKRPLPCTESDVRYVLNRIGPELFDDLMILYESAIDLYRSGYSHEDIDRLRKMKENIISGKDAYNIKMLAVGGKDLLEIGYSSGPELGEALDYLLDEVIRDPKLNQHEVLIEKASGRLSKQNSP